MGSTMVITISDVESETKSRNQMQNKGIKWFNRLFASIIMPKKQHSNSDLYAASSTIENTIIITGDKRKRTNEVLWKANYLVLCRQVSFIALQSAWGRLTKLVAAAAVARSGFPLILLPEIRGRADPGAVVVLVVRFGVVGTPLTEELRFAPIFLTGEAPEISRVRT